MRALQVNLDSKQILILDALRYSLLAERQAYGRLTRSLRAVERSTKPRPSEHHALSALGSAWQVIDMTYRARDLISQISGLSQRTPECQVFVRETAVIEDFRHFFQHMNSSISKLTKASDPIMGVLMWASGDRKTSYTMSVGHWTKGMESTSIALDTQTWEFVPRIQLSAAAMEVDLNRINERSRQVSKFVEKWLTSRSLLQRAMTGASLFKFGLAVPAVPNTRLS